MTRKFLFAAKAKFLIATIALTCMGTANAGLIINLDNDGFGGVIASISGSGTTTGGLGGVIGAGNIGEYVTNPALDNQWFTLATPLIFSADHTIQRIRIDHDGRIDDFHLDVTGRVRRNTAYAASGSSLVNGLSFADLNPGHYAGSNSRDVRRLGGLTVTVPSPVALPLLLGLVGLVGLRKLVRS